jgi:8-oxo-dGTP diphosphatase
MGGVRIRVAVCLTEGDRMLLVQHEKLGRRYWLLPGGGLERGETIALCAAREVEEETGYRVDPGRLLLTCEAIEPAGRHILNMIYAGRITGGELAVGVDDAALRDAAWHPRGAIAALTMYPPIGRELLECWDESFAGPVRELGNIWR